MDISHRPNQINLCVFLSCLIALDYYQILYNIQKYHVLNLSLSSKINRICSTTKTIPMKNVFSLLGQNWQIFILCTLYSDIRVNSHFYFKLIRCTMINHCALICCLFKFETFPRISFTKDMHIWYTNTFSLHFFPTSHLNIHYNFVYFVQAFSFIHKNHTNR
jgi:hypothetical protein